MANSSQSPSQKDKSLKDIRIGPIKIPRMVLTISQKLLFLGILALAVFYMLPQISSFESSVKILATLKPWPIVFALITQFLSYMGSGLTLTNCVKITNHKISAFRGMLITLVSASIGLVAGGMFGSAATTFRLVKASGGDNEGSSLAASLPPVFVDIVLVIISIFGLIFLLLIHDLTESQILYFFLITILLVTISIVFVVAVKHKDKSIQKTVQIMASIYKLLKKEFPIEKITKNLQHQFSTWDYLISGGWKSVLLGSTLNILFDIGTIYFIFIASGISISPFVLISGYGLPWLFGRMAFIFPGGVGVIESAMVALYTSLGIDNALATVVVLTYRVISFWLPSIFGFFVLPFLNRVINKEHPAIK